MPTACSRRSEQNKPTHNRMKAGDVVIALPSSGIHSNGYSLVRKAIT